MAWQDYTLFIIGGQGVCVNVERGNISFDGVRVGRDEIVLLIYYVVQEDQCDFR